MDDELDLLPDVSFADNFDSDLSASIRNNPDSPKVHNQ